MWIDKKFLPVKIALFCWFAAAFSTYAFLPVFLKHQGLSIANFSIIIAFSVCLQVSGGVLAAFIADKMGRVMPFWYFFLGLFSLSILCFTILPNVSKCNVEKVSFDCYNEEMFKVNATSCRISQNNPSALICYKITVFDENNNVEPNETSGIVVTFFPKSDRKLEMANLSNISGAYYSASDCTNCSLKNISSCASNRCKSLQIRCSGQYFDCNKNSGFWIVIYGILVVVCSTARTNIFRFFDIIVSGLTSESNSNFGRQRMYGTLGGMVGPLLVGIILDTTNTSNGSDRSYAWLFVCVTVFSALTTICMGMVNPKFHKPASKMWKKSIGLVKNLDIMLFFVLLVTMGCIFGFKSVYRNWYLKELGASDLLTGIVSGVSNLYGIPFLYNSKWCINKIGMRNVFVLGLLGHAVYSFSYSVMGEPWIAVLLESTAIVSYHLLWISAIQYSDVVAPEGLVATVKALAGALHFNFGKLGSSMVGGFVMSTYGGRAAFTVLGCIASVYFIIYGSYLLIQHSRKKEIETPLESRIDEEIAGKDPKSS